MPEPFTKKRYAIFLLVAMMGISGAGCRRALPVEQTVMAGNMTGTLRVAAAFARDLPVAAAAFQQTLEQTILSLDETQPAGELFKLNRIGGSARLPLTRGTYRILDLGRHYSGLTGGAYDFTTSALTDLWRRGEPSEAEIKEALDKTGMRFVESSDNGSFALTAPGVQISLGELAFAYAMDVAFVETRKSFRGGLFVRYPEMARAFGSFQPEETPSVPVSFRARNNVMALGELRLEQSGAVVIRHHPDSKPTPGAMDRPIIMDPRTGLPATQTRMAVVLGPLTTKAFALAEALLVTGAQNAPAVLANFPGYEALVVTRESPAHCWMTPGFAQHMRFNEAFRGKTNLWASD